MAKLKRVVAAAEAVKRGPFPEANTAVYQQLSLLWEVLGDEFAAGVKQPVKNTKHQVPQKKRLKQAA